MSSEFGRVSIGSVCQWLRTSRAVPFGLRVGIGLVFVYASIDKVVHPDQFAEVMTDYEILPKAVVNAAALWLAWLELVVGALLIAGVWVRSAALMVTALTVIFIGGVSVALTRGIGLHCGCFSTDPGGDARTWASLWQEGLLLLACLWLTARVSRGPAESRPRYGPTDPH